MKKENTSQRLKQLMFERGLRQIDILNLTKPYCDKYKVKMNKSDISQYVSGKNEPSQDKLVILAMALNVSEPWLMGFDTNKERQADDQYTELDIFEELLSFLGWSYESVPACGTLYANMSLSDEDKLTCDGCTDPSICDNCPHNTSDYYLKKNDVYYKVSNNDFEKLSKCLSSYLTFRIKELISDVSPMSELEYMMDAGLIDESEDELLAAHERVESEQNPDGKKHDLDIMKDDSEWE